MSGRKSADDPTMATNAITHAQHPQPADTKVACRWQEASAFGAVARSNEDHRGRTGNRGKPFLRPRAGGDSISVVISEVGGTERRGDEEWEDGGDEDTCGDQFAADDLSLVGLTVASGDSMAYSMDSG